MRCTHDGDLLDGAGPILGGTDDPDVVRAAADEIRYPGAHDLFDAIETSTAEVSAQREIHRILVRYDHLAPS